MRIEWRWHRPGALLLVVILTGLSPAAVAQEVETPAGVTATGFVDSYFSLNFARPATQFNRYRNFDVGDRQFDVALAELVFQKIAEPIGFRIDADFGSTNDLVQGGTGTTLSFLQQAYLTAVVPLGSGLTVDAGKFVTHMGFEVIESKDNWNYSRSFLFALAIPYYHVGLRVSYPIFANVTLTGHLCNGWNNVQDNNSSKTFGASLIAAPLPELTVIAGWIGGEEQPDSAQAGARNVVDLTVVYKPTGQLSLAANASLGREDMPAGDARWQGLALYARYGFSGGTGVAVRAESYDDEDGQTTGVPQRMEEITVTLEQSVMTFLLLRAEYRYDHSSVAVFDDREDIGVLQHQNTFTIGAVVSF